MHGWVFRHRVRVFVHRIRFPGQPLFSDQAANDLIGKTIIVGITTLDHAKNLVRQEQYRG